MAERDDVRAVIARLAREDLGWQGPLPEGDLSEHLDSVQRLTLVVAIEDHFRIAFDPEDEAGVRTVAQVEALIRRKLAEEGRDAGA